MKEINCPNCNQHIKILGTDYDLYLGNLKREEQEIERLKEEYMILQNASDEVEEEKDKEIERLNNIINELEKWLDKKEKLTFNLWNKGIHEVQRKLQELKGSGKE